MRHLRSLSCAACSHLCATCSRLPADPHFAQCFHLLPRALCPRLVRHLLSPMRRLPPLALRLLSLMHHLSTAFRRHPLCAVFLPTSESSYPRLVRPLLSLMRPCAHLWAACSNLCVSSLTDALLALTDAPHAHNLPPTQLCTVFLPTSESSFPQLVRPLLSLMHHLLSLTRRVLSLRHRNVHNFSPTPTLRSVFAYFRERVSIACAPPALTYASAALTHAPPALTSAPPEPLLFSLARKTMVSNKNNEAGSGEIP